MQGHLYGVLGVEYRVGNLMMKWMTGLLGDLLCTLFMRSGAKKRHTDLSLR